MLGTELHDLFGIIHATTWVRGEDGAMAFTQGPALTTGRSAVCDDAANCPICNYLAQGRVVGERFEGIAVTAGVACRSPLVPLCLPSLPLQPFQARAPPLA